MSDHKHRIYLVAGKRTPFGKFGGTLASIKPVDLAVHAAKSLINEAKIDVNTIDQVILGNVIPSSTDTLYGGRHVALKIGMDFSKPAYVLNRLCGSGIQSIMDSVNLIKLGEGHCYLAGGVENMSMSPHLIYGSRFGTRYGSLETVDMLLDALTDKFINTPMAITAENLAEKYSISREDCDVYSMNSHQKAIKATDDKNLLNEIAPLEHKKGTLDFDEHMRRDIDLESMAKLKPAFKKDGTVTPATASGVVDGAAMVLVASEAYCEKYNLKPLAEIIDSHVVGVDPSIMGIGPVPAINGLLEKNKMKMDQIDLFEINEAFAAQTLACVKELNISPGKLNIWGGAVALGHPLAATGTRISLTLAYQLKHYSKDFGIASACIGGGQGIGILLKRFK